MLGIPLGMLYCNAGEWLVHKYLLHGRGRDRASIFSVHWHHHHKEARRNSMYDASYERQPEGTSAMDREAFGVLVLAAMHLPLAPVAPLFTATVCFNAWRYHRVHKRAHLDPAWAREHLPWHYDHHMGPDQDANWCVTAPWFDELVGTRKRYAHTPREESDLARAKNR